MIFRSQSNDKKSKVLIVGDSGVGKTSIRQRYIKGSFREQELMTIGVEFSTTELIVDNTELKLEIYDVAGQDTFQIQQRVIKNIQGAIVVFDLTRHETFFSIRSWIDKIYEHNPKTKAPLFIIGNKQDLSAQREIPQEDIKKLVETLNDEKDIPSKHILYIETSAKTGQNTNKVFELMGEHIMRCYY